MIDENTKYEVYEKPRTDIYIQGDNLWDCWKIILSITWNRIKSKGKV